jgi:inner membrane transporter RhtA
MDHTRDGISPAFESPVEDTSLSIQVPPAILIIAGIVSTQVGAAEAHRLFGTVGAGGTVLLRVGFAAILLVLMSKGSMPRYISRTAYLSVILLGISLAGMNYSFYSSIARIPLGISITIAFIGPLFVAISGSRRLIDFLWTAMAAIGICLFAPWSGAKLDLVGIFFALLLGVFWGIYIIMNARVGKLFAGRAGLALAMVVAAAILLPVGITNGGTALLNPPTLFVGCIVAILSSALPYSLESEALRRIPIRVFSIILCLEPAVGALIGLLLLNELLDVRDVVGLLLVVSASVGVTVSQRVQSL